MAAVAQQLAPAGIVPRLASALELDELPTELRFHTGDPASLDAVIATVNGVTALTVSEPKAAVRTGDIGLFVDIGTEAFFSNLVICPNPRR